MNPRFSGSGLAVLVAVWLLAPGLLSAADDNGWVDLTGPKNLQVWRGKPTDWIRTDAVAIDEKNPRLLSAKEASGEILVNGVKGRAKDLLTRADLGDVELHLEFLIPRGSNSGVKFHGHYEIQICDSFGKKKVEGDDCGGVYPRAELKPRYHHIDKGIAPRVNACKAPGEWQTLDVIFLAPRFDKEGKKTANARIVKAVMNGMVIHENQELATPTGNNYTRKEMAKGPLLLQGDHGPVAFRHVRIRPYREGMKP